jgi:glc operon protein GlcG
VLEIDVGGEKGVRRGAVDAGFPSARAKPCLLSGIYLISGFRDIGKHGGEQVKDSCGSPVDRRRQMNRVRATWGGIVAVLLAMLVAGTATGELLTKKSLSLEDGKKAAAGAAAEAKKNNWKMAIAVVDDGGHLIYFERIDDTQVGSIDVSIGKARTALAFKRPTKALEDAINSGQNSALLSFPNVLPREGGIPLVVDGKVVGAIGISGGKSSEDSQVAKAGIDALTK